jgi:hypothetical protein
MNDKSSSNQKNYEQYYLSESSSSTDQKLHFTLENYIGDVHPYYENGKMYMFYLKTDGTYASDLLISNNLLRYEKADLFHDYHLPINPYYVLNVIKDKEGVYRSFYGAGTIMASSKSNDLFNWEIGMEDRDFNTLYQARNSYVSEGRDPFVFYDEDINKYRIVSTAYYTNAEWKKGSGMDCAIAISTSSEDNLEKFEPEQKELLRFTDGYSGEPEVTQMMKIGDRWYLFASMARRTIHHVGPVSYWIGDEYIGIDEVVWSNKQENLLTGEDLCAAQLVEIEDKLYLYGWIPQKSRENNWGGSLNLPREVFQKSDGTLATRFDPFIKSILCGKMENTISQTDKTRLQSTSMTGAVLKINYTDASKEKLIITMNNELGKTTLEIDPGSGIIKFVAQDGYCYSNINIAEDGIKSIYLVQEDDILEVELNEAMVLCCKLDFSANEAEYEIYSSDKFKEASLYEMKTLTQIETEVNVN